MSQHVAVIGCGLMGSALAHMFANSGQDVVVWNRTPEKARSLAGPNVRTVGCVADAVRGAEMVVLSLSTYDAAEEALDGAKDWGSTTLVNLITGRPTDAERFADWAAQRGARYLDGAILAYPQDIGTPQGMVVYAGAHAAWTAHEQQLMRLGGSSHYVSDVIGAANVLDVAVAGGFYSIALGAFLEAAAYADACGVPVEALRPGARNLIALLGQGIDEATEAISSGKYETDQATVDVITDAMRSWRQAMADAGQRAALISTQLENLERAKAAGFGGSGFYVLFEAAKRSKTPAAT